MNQTEIQICLALCDRSQECAQPRPAVTISQMGCELCIPDTRIANQLPKLLKRKLVIRMPTPADSVPFDRRQRFYKLTTEGCSHVDNFLEHIAPIEETLHWITSQKTDEAFSKYALHLRRGLDVKAFDSREKLKKAVLDRRLPTKRKLSLPLSILLATKKK